MGKATSFYISICIPKCPWLIHETVCNSGAQVGTFFPERCVLCGGAATFQSAVSLPASETPFETPQGTKGGVLPWSLWSPHFKTSYVIAS